MEMENETSDKILEQTIQVIVPQPCYDEFFLKFNVFHAFCLKLVLSRFLGFSVILGSVLVKFPQILKISRNKSSAGISIIAALCELCAISSITAYSYANQFPFSTYGEGMFLTIQSSMVTFLVLYYNNNVVGGVLFVLSYLAIMAYLLSPVAPLSVLNVLQSVNIPISVTSKLIQAFTNLRNGSTGQLSAVTVSLIFAGSVARVFTSVQETGDTLVITTHAVSAAFNGLIFTQILYYWNATPRIKKE